MRWYALWDDISHTALSHGRGMLGPDIGILGYYERTGGQQIARWHSCADTASCLISPHGCLTV